MEADLETLSPVSAVGPAPKHEHASSVSTLSTSRSNSTSTSTSVSSPVVAERRQRSSSNPDNGAVKRIVEHDSLVTVRLSEPPTKQLTLNTNVPATYGTISPARGFSRASHPTGSYFAASSPAESRRSVFANTLSPGSISPGPLSSPLDPNEALSPVTSIPSSSLRPNLQDELEGADDDSKTISGAEGDESDDEEVDWEELQKTEDAESKDNEEDVRSISPSGPSALRIASHICIYLGTDNGLVATDYCYAAGSTGTGERKDLSEPEKCQGASCRETPAGIYTEATASFNGAIEAHGPGSATRAPPILHAATASDDRP